jgi:ParB/RepB/Spo0J family partition protein
MATKAMTRKERQAAVSRGVFAPLARRDLVAGIGETVSKRVPLASITPNPNQPRQGVDETDSTFQELVGSIRQQGLIQPISLWQLDEDRDEYLIIAGERRWRAYRRLAETDPQTYGRIPATVTILKGEDPHAVALMRGLIENIVRQDLKDGERAAALLRLKESTGWSLEEIGDRMGMSVSRVADLSSIARHDVVREAVDDGRITQKQAIALGQGVKDGDLVTELVGVVQDLDPKMTREVVKIARSLPAQTAAAERAQTAAIQARELAATAARQVRTEDHSYPLHSNGAKVGEVVEEAVVLASTPLARLLRRRTARRDELAEVLQATCELLDIWPRRPVDS